MRILLASDHYPPAIGGGQLTTWFLAKELARRGHAITVATVWQPRLTDNEVDNDVLVFRLRQLRTAVPHLARHDGTYHQPPFADPVTTVALRRLINRFQPDIVHSHGWISYSCAAALLGKPTPLVLSARDYGYICANRTLLRYGRICDGPAVGKCVKCAGASYGRPKGWLAALAVLGGRGLLRRKIAGVHSVSEYVRNQVARRLADDLGRSIADPVIHETVTEDSTDITMDDISPYLSQLPHEPFILFVGALRRVKGVEELLAAYRRLGSAPPLVLIGTRESDTPLEIPPGVQVLTDFSHAAVLEAWNRCLFGVIPSRLPEPFGMVLVEAMHAQKAVITTVPGGHGDLVIDGVTGLLVPPGDAKALEHAMRRLLTDGALRDRLAESGYQRASTITADRALSAFEEFYRQVGSAQDSAVRFDANNAGRP